MRSVYVLALLLESKDHVLYENIRHQKLLFLLERITGLGRVFDFAPYKFGPYDCGVVDSIAFLEQKGLLERTDSSIKASDKAISNKEEYALKFPKIFKAAKALLSDFEEVSTDSLLEYVYLNFPEYALKSELANLRRAAEKRLRELSVEQAG